MCEHISKSEIEVVTTGGTTTVNLTMTLLPGLGSAADVMRAIDLTGYKANMQMNGNLELLARFSLRRVENTGLKLLARQGF